MIIEIGYTYQADKHSPAVTSWTYFYVKGDNLDKAKTKAKTHWKKFCNELGYKSTQVKQLTSLLNIAKQYIQRKNIQKSLQILEELKYELDRKMKHNEH